MQLFGLMAMISLNLGLLNLMPVPVLDGGHIAILALEGLSRRDFSMRVKEKMLLAGFVLLLTLMVTVIYNDLMRIQWIERLSLALTLRRRQPDRHRLPWEPACRSGARRRLAPCSPIARPGADLRARRYDQGLAPCRLPRRSPPGIPSDAPAGAPVVLAELGWMTMGIVDT